MMWVKQALMQTKNQSSVLIYIERSNQFEIKTPAQHTDRLSAHTTSIYSRMYQLNVKLWGVLIGQHQTRHLYAKIFHTIVIQMKGRSFQVRFTVFVTCYIKLCPKHICLSISELFVYSTESALTTLILGFWVPCYKVIESQKQALWPSSSRPIKTPHLSSSHFPTFGHIPLNHFSPCTCPRVF